MKTTLDVLESLGVKDIPIITIFNKYDLVKNEYFLSGYTNVFKISAKFKEGLRELVNHIDEIVYGDIYLDKFLIPYADGKIVNLLKEKADVIDLSYTDQGAIVTAKVSNELHQKLDKYKING